MAFDPAHFRDEPQDDADLPSADDWRAFLTTIDELRFSNAEWAAATLDGIHETVSQTQRVTDGQRRAVENIRAASERPKGRADGFRGRRYEGY